MGFAASPGASGEMPIPYYLVESANSLSIQAAGGRGPTGEASGHGDSWGVAWFEADGRFERLAAAESAADSSGFVHAAQAAKIGTPEAGAATVAIGHLRKASCGDVTVENAHPFVVPYTVDGESRTLLVAHNGTVKKPLLATLVADLDAAGRPEAKSDSDTAVLAGWLGLRAESSENTFEAITAALSELFTRAKAVSSAEDAIDAYSAVNLLIAVPEGLMALRQFSKDAHYYTLFARPMAASEGRAGWVVASEPSETDTAWEPLEMGQLYLFPAAAPASVRTAKVA